MAYWLLKTEPSAYSFDDLVRDGFTVWNGVRNAQALIHLRQMQPGDPALIYHSGAERAVVGSAVILRGPYPDPQFNDPKLVVVDLRAVARAITPVPLTVIKDDPLFAAMPLVRQPRLSVMPLAELQWQRLAALAGLS